MTIEQKEEDFYQRGLNKDGLSSYCRACVRKNTLEWRANNPGKRRAHQMVATALRNKSIVRPALCEKCGIETTLLAHHSDYKKPLKIIWVCDACHYQIHKENGQRLGSARGPNYKDF